MVERPSDKVFSPLSFTPDRAPTHTIICLFAHPIIVPLPPPSLRIRSINQLLFLGLSFSFGSPHTNTHTSHSPSPPIPIAPPWLAFRCCCCCFSNLGLHRFAYLKYLSRLFYFLFLIFFMCTASSVYPFIHILCLNGCEEFSFSYPLTLLCLPWCFQWSDIALLPAYPALQCA